MTREIPPDFGLDWRRALFQAGAGADALRIAWFLLDAAYTFGSAQVRVGTRLIRGEACLDGRSLERGRKWLEANGFLAYESRPGSRASYTLLLPEPSAHCGQLPHDQELTAQRSRSFAKASAEPTANASAELSAHRGHVSESEPSKPLTEEKRLLPERGPQDAEVDDGGATDRLIAFVRGSATSNVRPALIVGEVVTCRLHGPRPVVQVTAGVAYLPCGCQAVEEPSRA